MSIYFRRMTEVFYIHNEGGNKKISNLIGKLFNGPIDIIGDVHGEINALRLLLWHLGYDKQGNHPDERRIAFLGDLIDRGPNSPAVLELAMQFVKGGRAQCILGNHELNLIRDERKDGNEWFMTPGKESKYQSEVVSSQQKIDFIKFLNTLPLALEREDLRVVNASWNKESVNKLNQLN